MKIIVLILALLVISTTSYSQVKIFAIGFGETFVTKDSTSFNLTLDVNRIPGKPEAGGPYFVFRPFKDTASNWRLYLKPSVDINLGSSVSSAPNNISVGVPYGYAYDFVQGDKKIGLFSLYIEGSPYAVSDKSFTNSLYYGSVGPYLKYSITGRNGISVGVQIGANFSGGIRYQYQDTTNFYSRITTPVFILIDGWKAKYHKDTKNEKDFKRLVISNSTKFNFILADNKEITTKSNYFFDNFRLDFYIIPNLAINFTYSNGYEEPLFKQNNALSIGISLAH